MKKLLLIVVGGLIVLGAVWVSRNGAGESPSGTHAGEVADGKEQKQRVETPSVQRTKSVEPGIDHTLDYTGEELSGPVMELLGLDGQEHNYNSLGNAIGKLSKDLANDDVTALLDMLTWSNDRFPEGMRPIEINAVKNDVLDRLLRQNELPEGIGLQLVEMASNSENDPVWRDYCVQFMTPFYERVAGGPMSSSTVDSGDAVPPDLELQAVQDAMFAALDERNSTIAGTSLIGLELLSRTHEEFDRESIVDSALEIASDESASAASRMTALRMAAGVGPADYTDDTAETARLLAQTGETVLLRSGAIVTLGETGSEADRELLESYAMDENRQIADAAQLALAKMDSPQESVVDRSQPTVADESATRPQTEEKLPPVLIN